MSTQIASSVMAMTLEERFFDKVQLDHATGCLNWTSRTSKQGYGVFDMKVEGRGRRAVGAHRVSWFLEYGVWPEHTVDHLCYNRLCVNPRHLDDVPQSVNSKRAIVNGGHPNGNKTHCKRGHEFTPDNVRYGRRGNGKQFRICKTCDLEAMHRRRGPEPKKHPGPKRTQPDYRRLG